MTQHSPGCPLLEPCDDEVAEHGYCSMQNGVFCIHCHQWCACDLIAATANRAYDTAIQAISTLFPEPLTLILMRGQSVIDIIDSLRKEPNEA